MVMPSASGITLVKVEGWYDNEWGYANRLVDLSLVVGAAREVQLAGEREDIDRKAEGRQRAMSGDDRRSRIHCWTGYRCSGTSPISTGPACWSGSTSTCPSGRATRARGGDRRLPHPGRPAHHASTCSTKGPG